MKQLLIALALVSISSISVAAPFAKGDPKIGKALVDKSCLNCHASMFNGDASRIYTRPDHKVRTPQQLAARISACNANTGTGWFPEDETNVAAYLNQQYYKFK